jgi:hypothetical protein
MSQSSACGADRAGKTSRPDSAVVKMEWSIALSRGHAHVSGTGTKWPPKYEADAIEAPTPTAIRLDRAAPAWRALRSETAYVFGLRSDLGKFDRAAAGENAQPHLTDAGTLKNCMDSYRLDRGKRGALATAERALGGPCNIAYRATWRQGAKAATASRSERLGRWRPSGRLRVTDRIEGVVCDDKAMAGATRTRGSAIISPSKRDSFVDAIRIAEQTPSRLKPITRSCSGAELCAPRRHTGRKSTREEARA